MLTWQDSDTVELTFFVFNISLLANYRVKYYDYIVNLCSAVSCNWCVSLDVGSILALIIDCISSPAAVDQTSVRSRDSTEDFLRKVSPPSRL